jgi:aryl-alcohol dehydrogenase-like predicted oxidoreductase
VDDLIFVKREVLEAMLDTARDGEAQVVEFSKNNAWMAERAAALSKRKCSELIEVLLTILTGEEVSLSQRDDEDGE